MKALAIISISLMFVLCSQPAKVSDEDMLGTKPSPNEETCIYENNGSINKPLLPIEILEIRMAKAKTHCKKLGGLNSQKTRINAFERLNSNGSKYIIWNEHVFCNCDE